jgi:predicted hydrocarbon binding protein
MMTDYFYTQRAGRVLLLAMEEILGREGIHSVLRDASLASFMDHYPPANSDKTFSFETVGKLLGSLEQAYGPQGGRGTALRVGRACFQRGLRDVGALTTITSPDFRFLPLSTKLPAAANTFADVFNSHTDQRVRVEEKEHYLLWHIECCPLCWGRKANEPICYLAVGFAQEALYWLSGGKIFDVEETACIARGDSACTIMIDRRPIS